jgi:glycosyltransferase 2 family protein
LNLKRLLRCTGTVLKYGAPLAIIVWLLIRIEPAQWESLRTQPKNWPMLSAALGLAMSAVCFTIFRWYLLVRALAIPFRIRDAFRLGFLGYLLNFVSIGAVGGDLFKAVFLARDRPGQRTEAVSTVVVDRMIGLYALLVVTSATLLLMQTPEPTAELAVISRSTYLLTAIGAVGVVMVLVPGFTRGSLSEAIGNIPVVGSTLSRLIAAVRMYRRQPGTLVVIGVMSIGVHVLFAVALFLVSRAFYGPPAPGVADHLVIVPISMLVGALPLTPAGLGTFELAMAKLFQWVPAAAHPVPGAVIALVYRIITIIIAAIGTVYYWTSRREVKAVIEDARRGQDEPPGTGPDYFASNP